MTKRRRSPKPGAKRQKKERDRQRYLRNRKAYTRRNRERQRINREFVVGYLKTHGCVDCPVVDVRVLDFDHVRGHKTAAVSRMIRDSTLEKIVAEIAKCEVRCSNCHRIRHAMEREEMSTRRRNTLKTRQPKLN